MKIAMTSLHAGDDHQDAYVADLCSAVVRAGHEVVVYTRSPGDLAARPGHTVVRVPAGPPDLGSERELVPHLDEAISFLRREWAVRTPDVVHAHRWTSGLVSVLAASRLAVPVVQTFHSSEAEGGFGGIPVQRTRVPVERLIGREVARTLAVSNQEKSCLVDLGVPRSRITVVPYGVDVTRPVPEEDGYPRRLRYRIVSLGGSGRDGVFDVIAALRSVPDAELVVLGSPAADAPTAVGAVRERARALGVEDRVGFVERPAAGSAAGLLRSADVVVCAARGESQGAAVVEAMWCGAPVVASAVGTMADAVVDGVTGVLVPPRDPGALARVLRPLLADAARRDAYGTAGADRVEACLTLDHVASGTVRVYREVFEQHATSTAPTADATARG